MTFAGIKKAMKDDTLMCGKNSENENVIIQRLGPKCYCVSTMQNNGWCRKNYYYSDGSTEETYER